MFSNLNLKIFIHLEILLGIFKKLNNPSISSESLSFLTRALIFWENTLLEDVVQVLYGLKKGIITNSHHTSLLCDEMTWNKPLNEKQLDLLKTFDAAYQLSRFPFSKREKGHPLRDLIFKKSFYGNVLI